jgi:hypothetical protein
MRITTISKEQFDELEAARTVIDSEMPRPSVAMVAVSQWEPDLSGRLWSATITLACGHAFTMSGREPGQFAAGESYVFGCWQCKEEKIRGLLKAHRELLG